MKRKKGKKRSATKSKRKTKRRAKSKKEKKAEEEENIGKTSIQIGTDTRDRLYRLKFRKSYDRFLKELCELYETEHGEE